MEVLRYGELRGYPLDPQYPHNGNNGHNGTSRSIPNGAVGPVLGLRGSNTIPSLTGPHRYPGGPGRGTPPDTTPQTP